MRGGAPSGSGALPLDCQCHGRTAACRLRHLETGEEGTAPTLTPSSVHLGRWTLGAYWCTCEMLER